MDTILSGFGARLRELSLSGSGGNAAAWAIVLALTALPALGLLWKRRYRCDWLLVLAAAEIFGGLYFLVNPSLLSPFLSGDAAGALWSFAAAGAVGATALAWTALRCLRALERAAKQGRALERLLGWSAAVLSVLAVWSGGAELLERLRAAAEGNLWADLFPTNLTLCLLAAADLVPALLGCTLLRQGGKLAGALEADPFGEETLDLAERLRKRCGYTAAVSVLICAGGNLVQMLLFSVLRAAYFSMSFPAGTVLLAAALGLLCQYFRRAKAVSDDNASII